jgi:putative ATP-dependent endonuclease of OLD family
LLVEYFRTRAAKGNSAGELILIEEPEAHLHPQLQSTLLEALRSLPFQSIVSTHSTQVTAKVPVSSFIMLTAGSDGKPVASAPATAPALTQGDQLDLNRYLDATKSNLLFARKVMLVEGAAELLLLPPLVKQIMNVDLEREGISVIAIHGTHFGPYSRLFSADCLPKKCAIVGDADLDPEEVPDGDDVPVEGALGDLEGAYVKAFLGGTTFEREITSSGNLTMLASVAHALGAPKLKAALELQDLLGGDVPETLKDHVLRTAKRFGKARFAQVTARYVTQVGDLPQYVFNAVEWLMAE